MLSNFCNNQLVYFPQAYCLVIEKNFFAAIENNRQDIVAEFIAMGININCVNQHLSTPLHVAVGLGHLSIVKMLLSDQRINIFAINAYNQTPLAVAKTTRYFKIIELLTIAEKNIFEQSIANNYSFLEWKKTLSLAVKCGYDNVVAKLLLLYDYNINFKPYLCSSLKNGNIKVIEVIEEHLCKLNSKDNIVNVIIDQLLPANIKTLIFNKIINFCKKRLTYGIFNQLMANDLVDHMLTLIRLKKYVYNKRFHYLGTFCVSPLFLIVAYGGYDEIKRLWKIISDIGANQNFTFLDLVKEAWLQEGIVYGQRVNVLSYCALLRNANHYHRHRLEILLTTMPFFPSKNLKSDAFLFACIQLNKNVIEKFIEYNKKFLQSLKYMFMICARKNIPQDLCILIGVIAGFIKIDIPKNRGSIIRLGDLISINTTDNLLGRSALHSITRFTPSSESAKIALFQIIRMLINAKADPTLKDHQNNTPLSFARLQPNNDAIVNMLASAVHLRYVRKISDQVRAQNLTWQHNLSYKQPLPGSIDKNRRNPNEVDFGILRREQDPILNSDISELNPDDSIEQAVSSNSKSFHLMPN